MVAHYPSIPHETRPQLFQEALAKSKDQRIPTDKICEVS